MSTKLERFGAAGELGKAENERTQQFTLSHPIDHPFWPETLPNTTARQTTVVVQAAKSDELRAKRHKRIRGKVRTLFFFCKFPPFLSLFPTSEETFSCLLCSIQQLDPTAVRISQYSSPDVSLFPNLGSPILSVEKFISKFPLPRFPALRSVPAWSSTAPTSTCTSR